MDAEDIEYNKKKEKLDFIYNSVMRQFDEIYNKYGYNFINKLKNKCKGY
jgi:hypothetical protein